MQQQQQKKRPSYYNMNGFVSNDNSVSNMQVTGISVSNKRSVQSKNAYFKDVSVAGTLYADTIIYNNANLAAEAATSVTSNLTEHNSIDTQHHHSEDATLSLLDMIKQSQNVFGDIYSNAIVNDTNANSTISHGYENRVHSHIKGTNTLLGGVNNLFHECDYSVALTSNTLGSCNSSVILGGGYNTQVGCLRPHPILIGMPKSSSLLETSIIKNSDILKESLKPEYSICSSSSINGSISNPIHIDSETQIDVLIGSNSINAAAAERADAIRKNIRPLINGSLMTDGHPESLICHGMPYSLKQVYKNGFIQSAGSFLNGYGDNGPTEWRTYAETIINRNSSSSSIQDDTTTATLFETDFIDFRPLLILPQRQSYMVFFKVCMLCFDNSIHSSIHSIIHSTNESAFVVKYKDGLIVKSSKDNNLSLRNYPVEKQVVSNIDCPIRLSFGIVNDSGSLSIVATLRQRNNDTESSITPNDYNESYKIHAHMTFKIMCA